MEHLLGNRLLWFALGPPDSHNRSKLHHTTFHRRLIPFILLVHVQNFLVVGAQVVIMQDDLLLT